MKKTKRVSRTIIDKAKAEVKGFRVMYAKLEQKVQLGGLSKSTLKNYGRCIAKISVHFNCAASELEEEQINGYLQFLLTTDQPSRSYFKHTIYGLRFLFRVYGREYKALRLPSLKRSNPLPVVLSQGECKRLFKSGRILKHRVMLSLIYSAGLRSQEVRNLKWPDIDFDRMMIHIRKTKYQKDRYVPLSDLMVGGLMKYREACSPKGYVFNGKSIGSKLSPRGVQWAMKEAVKQSGITKDVTVHSLRHSYATHLLEYGLDIDTVRKLLGHSHLTTTMIYLHVARLESVDAFSPFDRLYEG
jgi:site-specific recombinase XerD